MKTNIKALELIEKGMTAKTVSKLTESQVNILYSKLLGEQVQEMPAKKSYQVGPDGGNLPPSPKGYNVKKTATGDVVATPNESELEEDVEVSNDPNKETETQDPEQVGPSSDDGFGNENDGDMSEGKKDGPNPWAICHSQVGPKKSRKWERCVREVKKQLGEGKNPVSLFLENEIMKIVERNILPRITKGDLIKHLNEEENFATKHLQSFGTKSSPKVKKEVDEQNPSTAPTTKPAPTKPGTKTPPKPRPSHPGKNPNPGEKDAPKAQKTSPEKAKNEIIDVIIKMLEK
jgi:hypothetical protein